LDRNSWILFFISVGPQNCDLDKRQIFGKSPGEKSNSIMPSSPSKKARVGCDKSEKAAAKIQGVSEPENAQGTDPEQILERCPQNKIPNMKLTLDKPNFGSFSAK
jgi:hypothetical protein